MNKNTIFRSQETLTKICTAKSDGKKNFLSFTRKKNMLVAAGDSIIQL